MFKITVTFHMKSGAAIKAQCNDIKIKSKDNDLISYEIIDPKFGEGFYLRLDDISAIQYYRNDVSL